LIKLVASSKQRALGLIDDARKLAGNDLDRWKSLQLRSRLRPRLRSTRLRPRLRARRRQRRNRSTASTAAGSLSSGLRVLLVFPLAIGTPHLRTEASSVLGTDALRIARE